MREAEPVKQLDAGTSSVAGREAELPAELLVWLSPVFPVGGFAYSQGLEMAVAKRWVANASSLTDWMSAIVGHGALANDLVLISLVIRAGDDDEVAQIAELSAALQPSAERAAEALDQGRNFHDAYAAGWTAGAIVPGGWPGDDVALTLPLAVALAARAYGFAARPVLEAFGVAQVNNLVSAAIRLGVIGQFDGQRVIAKLLPELRAAGARAVDATVDDLGTASFGADLATMLHETQQPRLFRS